MSFCKNEWVTAAGTQAGMSGCTSVQGDVTGGKNDEMATGGSDRCHGLRGVQGVMI